MWFLDHIEPKVTWGYSGFICLIPIFVHIGYRGIRIRLSLWVILLRDVPRVC